MHGRNSAQLPRRWVCLAEAAEPDEPDAGSNEQRIKVLTAREAAIQEIMGEAKLKVSAEGAWGSVRARHGHHAASRLNCSPSASATQLREVSKNPATYKKLLTDLLVQVRARQKEMAKGRSISTAWQRNAPPSPAHHPPGCPVLLHVLLQAMKKLSEKTATVKCRQVDLVLVKEVLETARKNYTALFQDEAPAVSLDQSSFLPPPPQGNDDAVSWCV